MSDIIFSAYEGHKFCSAYERYIFLFVYERHNCFRLWLTSFLFAYAGHIFSAMSDIIFFHL